MGDIHEANPVELNNGNSESEDLSTIVLEASRVLRQESEALVVASNRLFTRTTSATSYARSIHYLNTVLKSGGKIVVSGIGKSGIIAQKISATLKSVGISSCYLHPSDAIHGDLGCVEEKDALLIISYSGNTDECLRVARYIKRRGSKIIGICGNEFSSLVKECHAWIDASIPCEANSNIPIPTTSTTLALALGDAIVINLIQLRRLTLDNFAVNHPGGSLGKQLDGFF